MERPHFMWIDNFSKFLARSIPTLAKGLFSSCLWTGHAAFPCANTLISDEVRYDDQKNVIPAMPDDLLQHQDGITSLLTQVLAEGSKLYDSSLVKQFDVRNVPLKIDTTRFPEHAAVIDPHLHIKVMPCKLVEVNVGSNRGLAFILRQIYEENHMQREGLCRRYVNLNVDENIFWRTLRVSVLGLLFSIIPTCTYKHR